MPLEVALGAAAATLLLAAPGIAATAVLRVRLMPAIAVGSSGLVATIAAVAVVAELVGIPFGPWVAGVALIGAGGVIAGLARRRRSPRGRVLRESVPVVIAWVAAIAVLAIVAGPTMASGALSQTYDGVFHLNSVARIVQTGDASSFTMYLMTNPEDDVEFYPGAWHALAALLPQVGLPVVASTAATWLAVAAAVWLPGIAWLAATILPAERRTWGTVVALVLGALSVGFPYLLLDWGTLYPSGLAYSLLPVGVVLLIRLLRVAPDPRGHGGLLDVGIAVLWVAAAMFAHPRSLVTLAVVAVPIVAIAVIRGLRWLARRPGGRRLVVLVCVLGAALVGGVATAGSLFVLRYFGVEARPVSDRLNGGPARASETPVDAILQVLGQSPVISPAEIVVPASIGFAALVVLGLVLAARRAELRWITVAFLLLGILYVAAASSDSDVAKILTGLWYKDKFRLASALPLVAIPAAALAATTLIAVLRRRVASVPRRAILLGLGSGLVILSALPAVAAMNDALGKIFHVTAEKNGALLDAAELRLLERLPELLPADAVVAGNPWNGSSLSWAVGGVPSLYPHLSGRWGADRDLVAARLDTAASDPEVCAALDRLGVDYLLHSEGMLNGGDATALYFAGVDRAASAPGFTEIARDGGTALYRIDACD